MKTTALLLTMFISTICYAQDTTQEEYLFLVRGFKQMREAGLDMKKGYEFADTVQFETQDRKYSFAFFSLVRQKNKSLAGTAIIAYSAISGKYYYLGMPAAGSDGSVDHQNTLMAQLSNHAWDTGIRAGFSQALSEYLSMLLTRNFANRSKR